MALTSHSGDANVNDTINEGITSAANMDATGYGVEYFFSGLADDEDLFNINSSTGVVTFKAAPDYENPKDADSDNTYEVLVMAWDSIDGQVE